MKCVSLWDLFSDEKDYRCMIHYCRKVQNRIYNTGILVNEALCREEIYARTKLRICLLYNSCTTLANSAFHPFGVDKWSARLSSDEFYLALVAPAGECLLGKGPSSSSSSSNKVPTRRSSNIASDRIVGSTWRRLFLAAYLLWAKPGCCRCPAWQCVCVIAALPVRLFCVICRISYKVERFVLTNNTIICFYLLSSVPGATADVEVVKLTVDVDDDVVVDGKLALPD